MTQFASATFTGTNDTELSAADSNWSEFRAGDNAYITSNRLYGSGTNPPAYKHGSAPPSADYEVSLDFYLYSTSTTHYSGVCARIVDGQLTCYWARFRAGTGWQLFRYNASTATQLGSTYSETISAGSTRKIRLRVEGNVISVYRDAESSPIISVTDGSPLTDAGYSGILFHTTNAAGSQPDTFSADSIAAAATVSSPPARAFNLAILNH